MDYKKACLHLSIDPLDTSWTEQDLKRQYRKCALLSHPDKNRTPGAKETFQCIQESYEYLMKYRGLHRENMKWGTGQEQEEGEGYDENSSSYINTLFSFLKPILESGSFKEIKSKIIHTLVNYITEKCEPKALDLLRKLDKQMFATIREVLHAHKEVFYFSETFLDKIDEIYNNKLCDERIILHPTMDDLFSNNLYRLVEPGGTFLVPLWHHELVYDNSGTDLYIECVPILQKGVEIDEHNNIHISIDISLKTLWAQDSLDFQLGQQTFSILRKDLMMVERQTTVIENAGISKINTKDIYNVSKQGHIFVHLQIFNSFI
jgi:hypothetical protein